MNFKIEFDQEEDGRWIAEIPELPGVMAYGATQAEAEAAVEALALRVIATQISKVRSASWPSANLRTKRFLPLST